MLRCVIFDLDQTLGSTAGVLYASFNAALAAAGRPAMTPSEIVGLFGPPEWVALKSTVGGAHFPVAFDAYLRHYIASLPQVRLYDGIREVLEEAGARGIFRGVITGKGRATTEVTLMHLGVRTLLDLVLTADELPKPKPDPGGIHWILNRAGAAPEEALMVGDLPADIEAARAAGVRSGAALWDAEWPERLRAAKPDFIFETVQGLREFLASEGLRPSRRSWGSRSPRGGGPS
jgi:pyrophosphatase PpaX